MFVEEIPSPIHLFLIESAAPSEMYSRFVDLRLDYRWVPLCLVEVLDVGERRAHWRPNQQLRVLLVQELLCFYTSRWVVEVPRFALIVRRGEVERDSRDNSQSGISRRCYRHPGR